ncbi:MAG: hypothetical protein RLZZ396_2178 [Planctomycetota bacterium]|jgi:hypothetical protein
MVDDAFLNKKLRNLLRAIICLIVGLLCVGCKQPQVDPQEQEHEHFPVHWPHDIMRASKRIDQLLADAELNLAGTRKSENWPTATAELADLVGWLPILAADSDLGRKDFASIDSWSSQWTDLLRKHASNSEAIQGLSNLEGFKEVAVQLGEICQAEQARIDRLTQDF